MGTPWCLCSPQSWDVSLISAGSEISNFLSTSQQPPPIYFLSPKACDVTPRGAQTLPLPHQHFPGWPWHLPASHGGSGGWLGDAFIDNKIEASAGNHQSPVAEPWGWAPLLFPLQPVMGSLSHCHFHSSQPGHGKGEPELGAGSGCRVLREVLFQKHRAEHPQILFYWCHALCALPLASIPFPSTPGTLLGCGVGIEGAFSSRKVPIPEFCCPQGKPCLDLPILM